MLTVKKKKKKTYLIMYHGVYSFSYVEIKLSEHRIKDKMEKIRVYLEYTVSWRRKWQPTLALLTRKFSGWKSLVGYSPWDRKEPNMTEQFQFHFHTVLSFLHYVKLCNTIHKWSVESKRFILYTLIYNNWSIFKESYNKLCR